jgi:hypothetical protein
MSEERDPLDAVFGSEEAGTDTTSGQDTNSGTGTGTQTAPEEQGKDSITGGAAEDKVEDTGKVTMVPKAALDEARQRARDAEERLAAKDKGGEDTTTGTDAPAFRDPKEDPEGFAEDLFGAVQLNMVNTTLNLSEKMARKEHGAELVDSVREWTLKRFETDPDFASRIITDPDPYEKAIEEYKTSQRNDKAAKLDPEILEGLDDEEIALLKQHRASKSAKTGGDTGSEKGGSTAETSPRAEDGKFVARRSAEPPPRSIASAPPGGGKPTGQPAVGEGVAFDDTFK